MSAKEPKQPKEIEIWTHETITNKKQKKEENHGKLLTANEAIIKTQYMYECNKPNKIQM